MKPLEFHPKALAFIRNLPVSLRKQIGEALRDIQKGLLPGMPLNKPMPSVAPGVYELRVKDETKKVRIFYITKLAHAILVFHAFEKKTKKTPKQEIKLGKQRMKEMVYG